MAEDLSKLTIGMPDFGDRKTFLTTLGTIVADGIVTMIEQRRRPDGTWQKENSPGYALAKGKKKGYTTPLKGMSDISPYLARRSTFLKTFYEPDTLIVHLNSKRAEIGKTLTDRGYWFMGITADARAKIQDRTYKYLQSHLREMWKGNWT